MTQLSDKAKQETSTMVHPHGSHGDKRAKSPLPEQVKTSGVSATVPCGAYRDELWQEQYEAKWSTLVWIVGERFALEISDMDNAVLAARLFLEYLSF